MLPVVHGINIAREKKMLIERNRERTANVRKRIFDLMVKYKTQSGLTAKQIADETGITKHTVQGHVDHSQPKYPNMEHFFLYERVYGTSFVNDALSIIGMGHARRTSRTIICPFSFHAESARWAADQAVALADRVLDHQEKVYLAPIALKRAEDNWQFHQFLTGAN